VLLPVKTKADKRRSVEIKVGLFLTIQMTENFYRSLFGHLWGIFEAFELLGKSKKVYYKRPFNKGFCGR
jgi:hypothetical protein